MDIVLTDLAVSLIGLLAAALTAATAFVVPLLRKYLGEKNAELARTYLIKAVEMGVAFAINKVEKEAPKVNVKEGMAALAVQYVLANVPQALEKLGLTEENVRNMVEARLGLIDVMDSSKDTTKEANTSFVAKPLETTGMAFSSPPLQLKAATPSRAKK